MQWNHFIGDREKCWLVWETVVSCRVPKNIGLLTRRRTVSSSRNNRYFFKSWGNVNFNVTIKYFLTRWGTVSFSGRFTIFLDKMTDCKLLWKFQEIFWQDEELLASLEVLRIFFTRWEIVSFSGSLMNFFHKMRNC